MKIRTILIIGHIFDKSQIIIKEMIKNTQPTYTRVMSITMIRIMMTEDTPSRRTKARTTPQNEWSSSTSY